MTERIKELAGSKTSLAILTVLVGFLGSWLGGWYGVRSDIRVQGVQLDRLEKGLAEVTKKMPDGALIDKRLDNLEGVVGAARFFEVAVRLKALEDKQERQERDFLLFEDYTSGRIWKLPYQPPPAGRARKRAQ